MNLKDMVKGDKFVDFVCYKDSALWYCTECGFENLVPISDIGNATFLTRDRAMLFMRYLRKHMAMLEQAKAA
ncbi:MAG TPA: hypothetical protein VF472_12915 [Burkholderiaceae bacterium]